ncbi:MAG: hypothetical protein WBA45_08330 [Microthrixaceae bacterium]
MAGIGGWHISLDGSPVRLDPNRSLLEARLEGWIEADPTIIDSQVRWVSRQLVLPDRSRLDLLGLSPDGTWVIVELKAGSPGPDAVRQAIHYFMEMDAMSNAALVARIRAQGLSDHGADRQLDELLSLDEEEHERDYRIIVAGIGEGDAANSAAETLARYGFSIPVEVVTFYLFDTATGHVLIRDVEEETAPDAPSRSAGWSLDSIFERAERFGVREGFEQIRTELLNHGYRSRLKKYSLNFSVGARRGVFYLGPATEGLHIGYLQTNFEPLFGVPQAEAERMMGENWLTVPPEAALAQIRTWIETVDQLRNPPKTEADSFD